MMLKGESILTTNLTAINLPAAVYFLELGTASFLIHARSLLETYV